MKPIAWMVAASAASWALVTLVSEGRVGPELVTGMAAPLAAAVVSWLVYEWAHGSAPGRLTTVMIGALAVKMLFFGGYVVVVLRVLEMRLVPFVVSFASYFIALHAMEALFLRRLLMDDLRPPAGERA